MDTNILRVVINGPAVKIEGLIKKPISIKLGATEIWPRSSFIQSFICNLDDGLGNISIKFTDNMTLQKIERILADKIRIQNDLDS